METKLDKLYNQLCDALRDANMAAPSREYRLAIRAVRLARLRELEATAEILEDGRRLVQEDLDALPRYAPGRLQ